MMELEDYGIDLVALREMYARWQQGATKSGLEIEYLGKVESHGKLYFFASPPAPGYRDGETIVERLGNRSPSPTPLSERNRP